jgi:endonuclease IV
LVVKGNELSSDSAECLKQTLQALSCIKEHADKLDINLFLENGAFLGRENERLSEVVAFPECHIEFAKKLNMGIVLDLGHAALSSNWDERTLNDFISAYSAERAEPQIMHFSDNCLEYDDHSGLEEGMINMEDCKKAINNWPYSLMTVETFPGGIGRSLDWLIKHSDNSLTKSDAENLCNTMGWNYYTL